MHRLKFIEKWGSDEIIVNIARLSHGVKRYRPTEEVMDFLIRKEHFSVLEFGGATFYVETSIAIARQFMRHRHFSFLERSLRYVILDEGEIDVRENEYIDEIYEAVSKSFATYEDLISNGVPGEVARMVLPMGLKTKFFVSGNLREWIHFLRLRTDSSAQLEMRLLAEDIAKTLELHFPITFEKLKKYGYLKEGI